LPESDKCQLVIYTGALGGKLDPYGIYVHGDLRHGSIEFDYGKIMAKPPI
jgi:hypothetical protein